MWHIYITNIGICVVIIKMTIINISNNNNHHNHHLVIVTGANKGFGRSLVESYYRQFRQELNSTTTTTTIVNKLTLVLVGRNYDSLNSVKQNILNKEENDDGNNGNEGGKGRAIVDIRIIENFDLGEMENLNSNLERLWQQIEAS